MLRIAFVARVTGDDLIKLTRDTTSFLSLGRRPPDFPLADLSIHVQQSVRLWFENLAAMDVNDRLPLSRLEATSHLHGGLRLELAGRLVPCMGYWGPDDVCFAQWLGELRGVATAFSSGDTKYVFDECEQGQPAFVFERVCELGYFSLADSMADGEAAPDWQRVEFQALDLVSAIHEFEAEFNAHIRRECSVNADAWLERVVEQASDT